MKCEQGCSLVYRHQLRGVTKILQRRWLCICIPVTLTNTHAVWCMVKPAGMAVAGRQDFPGLSDMIPGLVILKCSHYQVKVSRQTDCVCHQDRLALLL